MQFIIFAAISAALVSAIPAQDGHVRLEARCINVGSICSPGTTCCRGSSEVMCPPSQSYNRKLSIETGAPHTFHDIEEIDNAQGKGDGRRCAYALFNFIRQNTITHQYA
ncbi:hypothetical protein PTTW11_00377 [Pyrenophora teres f. teres]|uniref:Uncharacterized protein n=1 Tax=Pyrenophora teres f. teres TaxID=97479 RepID=A0A6S6VBR2_9PLEO|nr:hypothetical protein PTNB29_05017 [Pyrenophora teres f. teres]CAE6996647.1 hypothetical protein PTTW11_00377 [Pyrenophora teres f. teres]